MSAPAGTVVPAGPVLPRYGERSLADVLPAVLAALTGGDAAIALPPASRYVVLLVDGLGWNLLTEYAADAPYLSTLAAGTVPVTTGVPSTTATSLVSLGTGLPPGRHGVVGYTCAIPGTDSLLNALRWSPDVDALSWQPHPTVFDRATRSGIAVHVLSRRAFQGSGLTTAALRGGTFRTADTPGQRVAAAADAFTAGSGPRLVYVYEGDLDFTGHHEGCRSAAFRHELGVVDEFAARLRRALPADAVLLVTGDHGMVDVPQADRLDVDEEPELRRGLRVLGGEARFRHVYARAGMAGTVLAAWRAVVGDRGLVRSRAEAVEAGWFGPVGADVAPRLGDVVVAALGSFAIEYRSAFPREANLVGLHGSLSPDEMLVPLLVDPGDRGPAGGAA